MTPDLSYERHKKPKKVYSELWTTSGGGDRDEGKMGDNLMMGTWQNRPGALFSIFCIFSCLRGMIIE